MAEIKRIESLIAKLRERAARSIRDDNVSVIVGFISAVALWVHEMIERHAGEPRQSGVGVYWGPRGGPKFLEGPARELSDELGKIAGDAVRSGKTLAQGLLLAGLRLQRESQMRVPVEYGNLKASAFTRLENKK